MKSGMHRTWKADGWGRCWWWGSARRSRIGWRGNGVRGRSQVILGATVPKIQVHTMASSPQVPASATTVNEGHSICSKRTESMPWYPRPVWMCGWVWQGLDVADEVSGSGFSVCCCVTTLVATSVGPVAERQKTARRTRGTHGGDIVAQRCGWVWERSGVDAVMLKNCCYNEAFLLQKLHSASYLNTSWTWCLALSTLTLCPNNRHIKNLKFKPLMKHTCKVRLWHLVFITLWFMLTSVMAGL